MANTKVHKKSKKYWLKAKERKERVVAGETLR